MLRQCVKSILKATMQNYKLYCYVLLWNPFLVHALVRVSWIFYMMVQLDHYGELNNFFKYIFLRWKKCIKKPMLLYGIIQSMTRNPREKSRQRGKTLILFNMNVTVKRWFWLC